LFTFSAQCEKIFLTIHSQPPEKEIQVIDKEVRDRAMEKIHKLLAIANDGRGNIQEAETAARQAAALMAKYNIDSAEAQLADLASDQPDLTEEFCSPEYDPGAKGSLKTLPTWIGMTAIGVARLCQVKCVGSRQGPAAGVRFSGYRTDVLFAQWLLPTLCRAIFFEARTEWGKGTKADREDFRRAAAGALQRRLQELRREQEEAMRGDKTAGTALIVVDRKLAIIKERFGEASVKKVASRVGAATADGHAFGQRMNIPTGRPLGGVSSAKRLS
jgi:Protein of unknown function (DUF2786)